MATFTQRGQAIGNALLNGTATPQQLDRLGRALAYRSMRLSDYAAGDDAAKAEIFVTAFREFCIEALKDFEKLQAVAAAKAATDAAVETDFPQAP